jgi:ABC-type polysaccharide/polyol phosphate export permease
MLHSPLDMGADSLRAAWGYRDLLRHLVLRDLRHKYKGSSLGFVWSLLHPLLMGAVYTVAFRFIAPNGIAHFPVFLLSGLLPWMFFSAALSGAVGSIADNSALVRKVAFPRQILPLAAVASQFVQFLLMYTVIIPLLVAFGVGSSPALLALVPLILLQVIFTAGLALGLATAYVYARDTRHLLEVGLQVWFWITPILYSASLLNLPRLLQQMLRWNPMAHFITGYQNIVVYHVAPTLLAFVTLTLIAGGTALGGWLVFTRYQRRFAELI